MRGQRGAIAPVCIALPESTPEKPMSSIPDIHTQRLTLVAITPDILRIEPLQLSQRMRADVPDTWPPEHWEPHVYDFIEKQCHNSPHAIGWNRYIVLRSPKPTLIGTLGGFPKTPTETEVGYSVLPPWQRQGIATEGLQALIEEIFTNPDINTISAQTFPHLIASTRVLQKSGFTHVGTGDEEATICYRLKRLAFS
jgi:[ribosomal protein S5]-alanine N-acetyltransferase